MNNGTATVCEEMVEYFYRIPTNVVVTVDEIAKHIRDARINLKTRDRGEAITSEEVTRMVCSCRRELELSKKTTLINVRNRGYKLATPKELALYAAQSARRTIRWADRTWRVLEICDRKLLPNAIRSVFPEAKIRLLSRTGQKFVTNLVQYTKQQKRITEEKTNGTRT